MAKSNLASILLEEGFNDSFSLDEVANEGGKLSIKSIGSTDFFGKATAVANYIGSTYKDICSVVIIANAGIDTSVLMMSSCLLGIPHVVLFPELSVKAIVTRFSFFTNPLVLCDCSIDKALRNAGVTAPIESVQACIAASQSFSHADLAFRLETDWLFSLFTSGSTGNPKCIDHSKKGYLRYAAKTCVEYFGLSDKSVVLCASDAGWINGHTYSLYGPIMTGANSIVLKDPMILANPVYLQEILSKLKPTVLYLPVTLAKIIRSFDSLLDSIDSESIKVVGTMGEPLAAEVSKWLFRKFLPESPIVNTYFQTETGGILLANRWNDPVTEESHGSVGLTNQEIFRCLDRQKADSEDFELVVNNLWDGVYKCCRTIEDGSIVKIDAKAPYRLYDIAKVKGEYIYIGGRTDDTIKLSGRRYSSGELESSLLTISEILEVAVTKDTSENRLMIFLTLKDEVSSVSDSQIIAAFRNNLGSQPIPFRVLVCKSLPKTRSGKILRKALRAMIDGCSLKGQDYSTLINPESLVEISELIQEHL